MKMLKRQVLNPLHILAQHLFVVILRIIVYLTKNFIVYAQCLESRRFSCDCFYCEIRLRNLKKSIGRSSSAENLMQIIVDASFSFAEQLLNAHYETTVMNVCFKMLLPR